MKENYKSNKPCVACGLSQDGMVTYHHLLTRKAHNELKNDPRVLISVCQKHHNDFHNKGTSYMAEKYLGVMNFLISHGWHQCELTNKWRLSHLT